MTAFPEFNAGPARLINGDCLEVMASLDDATFDAVIVDPPYSSGATREAGRTNYNKTMTRSTGDRDKWFGSDSLSTDGFAYLMRACALEWFRVLRPGGHLLCFIDWRMLPAAQAAIESADLRKAGLLVWNKCHFGMGQTFRNQHELVMHFTRGIGVAPLRRDVANVLNHKPVRGGLHPTEKPVALLVDLLSVVCPVNGVVLDCFAGSSSTGEAALTTGRRFVGIERDDRYFAAGAQRLQEVVQRVTDAAA